MSAILGIFAGESEDVDEPAAHRVLAAMRRRGQFHSGLRRLECAMLGVARQEWELGEDFSGSPLVVEEPGLAAVADATLYYRDDLLRKLRSADVVPSGDSPTHLIMAAYRAWGTACTDHLEGDWAFVLWDRKSKRVFCARDFGGKRPLFYSEPNGALHVASSMAGLLAHPLCSRDLDLTAIAADTAGLFAAARETAYRAISLLPAGWSLVKERGAARLQRHWSPPDMIVDRSLGFEDAAERLRELLHHALVERLPRTSPPSVWLSGGWDSTAVFGSGERASRSRPEPLHLLPVSLSFPPGDPGREDELIQAVAEHWRRPLRWLDVSHLPLLKDAEARAAERDEPFAHAFEEGNRALSRTSRQLGARVAFDGSGGDQLFQVTPVYFADLLRTFRWLPLAREWRRKRLGGPTSRAFFRWGVQPLLPRPALFVAKTLFGSDLARGYLERPIPEWIDARFVRVHGLAERERKNTPPRLDRSRANYETTWYLTHPYFPRVFAAVAGFALEEGVELRSPLYDRRIVEFALTRPREERSSGAETKRLLRRAMRGLLPDHILAPRRFRTGTSGGYLDRSLRERHAAMIDRTFQEPLALSAFGIVDAPTLRRSWRIYLNRGGGELGVNLFLTLQSELWLRARYRV